jgi:hypothetical protein
MWRSSHLFLFLAAVAPALPFDLSAATSSAYLSAASYCPPAAVQEWACKFCRSSVQNVTYLYNASTETAGFVGWDTNTSTIVLSFRGTVTDLEWLEDFDLTLVDPRTGSLCPPNTACVAQGFYFDAYVSVRSQMHRALSRFPASAPILVTGHSLGAVMAEYAALELGASRVASVYTFGTPRGGNAAFAATYVAAGLPAAFRVTHAEDPVPHLPPEFLNYQHPPREVFFPSQSNWSNFRVCSETDGEDPACCDSTFPVLPQNHNVSPLQPAAFAPLANFGGTLTPKTHPARAPPAVLHGDRN